MKQKRQWICLWLGCCLLCFFPARAQWQLSLLTVDDGKDLYAAFGHSAFRLQDTSRGIDLTYNYGIFDFDTPHFYPKFIRGTLPYKLGKQPYDDFLRSYQREKRSVFSQSIHLPPSEMRSVVRFLEENYRPENRYYAYKFLTDNCATRLRDVLEENTSLHYLDTTAKDYTYRELLHQYVDTPLPWVALGFDLALGAGVDRIASFREQMFLPDYLSSHFMQLTQSDNSPALAVTTPVLNYRAPIEASPPLPWFSKPIGVFSILSLLSVLVYVLLRNHAAAVVWAQVTLFIIGAAGWVLVFLWWGTNHEPVKDNWNLLWLNPLAWVIWLPIGRRFRMVCLTMLLFFALFACIGRGVIPQSFPLAFVPMQCWILVTYAFMLWRYRSIRA